MKTLHLNRIASAFSLAAAITLMTGCSGEEEQTGTTGTIQTASVLTFANSGIAKTAEGAKDASKTAVITLRLNRAHTEAIVLNYETSDLSAIAGTDYAQSSGQITIAKGEREAKVSFTVFGDSRYETDESFEVNFSFASGGSNVTFDNRTARVEISNDDPLPVLAFTSPSFTVAENVGDVELTLALDRESDLNINAHIEYSGLANNGTDYLSDISDIVFAPGEKNKTITLSIIKDDIIEGGEQISVSLTSPVNAELGDSNTGFVLILGDLAFPDTGVVKAYADGSFNSDLPDTLHPYQDHEYGLDKSQNDMSDGYAGMVYTKIDKAGNALPKSAENDLCIYDANTGLTWEKKTAPETIPALEYNADNKAVIDPLMANWRSESYKYFWRTRDNSNSGGSLGGSAPKMFDPYGGPQYPYAPDACAFPSYESSAYVRPANGCTTDVYVEIAQNTALCGFKSWRLPSINELMSIVTYEESQSTHDAFYYDDMINQDQKLYLSDTPSVENDGSVWCLNVAEKRAQLCKKNNFHHVRIVRGNRL